MMLAGFLKEALGMASKNLANQQSRAEKQADREHPEAAKQAKAAKLLRVFFSLAASLPLTPH